jgi:hypothetical protein
MQPRREAEVSTEVDVVVVCVAGHRSIIQVPARRAAMLLDQVLRCSRCGQRAEARWPT